MGFRSTEEGGEGSVDTRGEEVAFQAPRGARERVRGPRALPTVIPGLRVAFLLCAGKERKHEPCWALPDPPRVLSSLIPSLAMPDRGLPRRQRGAQAEGKGCYMLPGLQGPF